MSEAPGSIEDIQNFSENFEGDGQIQDIFVWNVNDIFVDFFTIGNYVNLGGAAGDRVQEMTLNSEEIRNCLTVYQELSQFFAIDRSAVSENQIVQDFADGKVVYAIVRDDSIQKLDELLADGQFSYGVAPVPDLNLSLIHILINFTPHLVPMNRGILITAYASLTGDFSYEEVKAAYDKYYQDEFFVRVLDKDVCPQTKWVEGSNYVDVNFKIDPRTHRVIMMGAMDNLVKGAAGQAVQNMNLMFGLEETKGLKLVPMFP